MLRIDPKTGDFIEPILHLPIFTHLSLFISQMDEEWGNWYNIQQYRCLERDTASHGIDPGKVGTIWAVQNHRTLSIFLNGPLWLGPLRRLTTTNAIPMPCKVCGCVVHGSSLT